MSARILVMNPNSSVQVTAAIDAAMQPLRLPGGPAIDVDRLPSGPPSIGTQQDVDGVVMKLVEWVRGDDADAFVLACFSDPGLHAVREAAIGRPVFGIAECGILRALMLGERFGIIALSGRSVQRQQRYVRQMGVAERYAGSVPVDATAGETAGEAIRERLAQAGRRLAEQGADVLVLGCAGMAGHRRALEEMCGRPVVEPTQWAVVAAIGAVVLGRG
ncbi:MAG TPA: aspartate/glutamate racemase family protein [Acidisphaera sp.]|nr:aspartate/glutamate racemase family protein [Acidisphaera sp.]